MKRFILAGVVLLTIPVSCSLAGYLVVRVIVEGSTANSPKKPTEADPTDPRKADRGKGSTDPNSQSITPAVGDPARSIVVVIPYSKPAYKRRFFIDKKDKEETNPVWPSVLAHGPGVFGPVPNAPDSYTTYLYDDNTTVQLYTQLADYKTRRQEIEAKHEEWAKEKTDSILLYEILVQSLEYGLIPQALQYSDELLAVYQAKKGKGPAFPAAAEPFIKIYAQLQSKLKDPPTGRSDAESWRQRLAIAAPKPIIRTTGHYSLIYWDESEEVGRRLTQLNDNLIGFYLWYATQGISLPVPEKPLNAVLPATGLEVPKLQKQLDGMAIVVDGFYSPADDLVVLSPERLDGVGLTFRRQMQRIYERGTTRTALLKGPLPKINSKGVGGMRPEEVAQLSTMAAVEHYCQEEFELAAVSREGSRQLLYATGQLPRHVMLPRWLTEGAANVFDRPRGPVFFTKEDGKSFITVSTSTGFVQPNFVLQKLFHDQLANGEVNKNPGTLLRHVLTDGYFAAGEELDPPAPIPGATGSLIAPPDPDPAHTARKKRERMLTKPQTTSWALYYYLLKRKPQELAKYVDELNRLPRDFPFDEKAHLDLFCQSFGLSLSADSKTLDVFAADWLKFMQSVPPVGIDIPLVGVAPPTPPDKDKKPTG